MSSLPSAADLYRGLMLEVKARTSFVHLMILERKEGKSSLPFRLAREVCCLQLRMSFESVALACLCANRHHVTTGVLDRVWHAGTIMKQLSAVNPAIFPRSATITRLPTDTIVFSVDPPPLTKADFMRLYGKLGEVLHRQTLRDILSAPLSSPTGTWSHFNADIPLGEVESIHDLMVKWLNCHVIPIDGVEHVFLMLGKDGYPELLPLDRVNQITP